MISPRSLGNAGPGGNVAPCVARQERGWGEWADRSVHSPHPCSPVAAHNANDREKPGFFLKTRFLDLDPPEMRHGATALPPRHREPVQPGLGRGPENADEENRRIDPFILPIRVLLWRRITPTIGRNLTSTRQKCATALQLCRPGTCPTRLPCYTMGLVKKGATTAFQHHANQKTNHLTL